MQLARWDHMHHFARLSVCPPMAKKNQTRINFISQVESITGSNLKRGHNILDILPNKKVLLYFYNLKKKLKKKFPGHYI